MRCAQVRFTARSFSVAGDHTGQASHGHRWPFGPVALITVRAEQLARSALSSCDLSGQSPKECLTSAADLLGTTGARMHFSTGVSLHGTVVLLSVLLC